MGVNSNGFLGISEEFPKLKRFLLSVSLEGGILVAISTLLTLAPSTLFF